jgi:hypothetical protein
MKTAETREVYKTIVSFWKQDPEESDYLIWRAVLGNYEKAEVLRAVTAWAGDETQVEAFGGFRSQGSFMPKPADIKAIVVAAKRKAAETEAKKFQACGRRFPGGWWCEGGSLMMRLENPDRVKFGEPCECWKAWKGIAATQKADHKAMAAGS